VPIFVHIYVCLRISFAFLLCSPCIHTCDVLKALRLSCCSWLGLAWLVLSCHAVLGLAWLGLAWLGLAWLGLAGLVWSGLVSSCLVLAWLVWSGLVWSCLVLCVVDTDTDTDNGTDTDTDTHKHKPTQTKTHVLLLFFRLFFLSCNETHLAPTLVHPISPYNRSFPRFFPLVSSVSCVFVLFLTLRYYFIRNFVPVVFTNGSRLIY
jgi:hypothetical protein